MTVSGSANFIAGRESGAGCGLAQAPAQTRALGRSSRRLQNRRTSSPQKGQRQCSSIQTPLAAAPMPRWRTLIETALMTHDFVLPPLKVEERARYYAESHLFAALFGIPRSTLPADWREFAAYTEMMLESDVLMVSPAAREVAGQIFSRPGILLRPPQWYRAVTASMLPPRLKEAFGLSDVDRSQSERARAWLRRIDLHCRLDCAMSARIKRRWRGCRDGGRQTSPRRRSTGSGSDETGSLDEFIT